MIILIFGLPGTGKTTIAEHLAQKIGAAYIGTDQVRQKMELKGKYDPAIRQQVYEELFKELHALAETHSSIVVDGTFYKQVYRERIKSIAKTFRQKFMMIDVKSKDTSVRERMLHPRKYSEADYEVYEIVKGVFEEASEPHLVLYSDKTGLAESIEKAMVNIKTLT